MLFKKIRAFILLFLTSVFAKILCIKIPPILSVAAYIKKDDKLLFINYSYLQGWGFPGGIVEGNETLLEALVREVKEETGLTVTRATYRTSVHSFFKGINVLTVFFDTEGEGTLTSSEEGEIAWKDPHTMHNELFYTTAKKGLTEYLQN